MDPCYVDLLIRIGAAPGEGRPYPVEATLDGSAHYYGGLFALDTDELRALSLDATAYGDALAKALLGEPIGRAHAQARARAEALCQDRMRLRLQIDPAASALQSVHWERLRLPHRGRVLPVAAATESPFSRYTALESIPPPPLAERPVRMLIAVASPGDLDNWQLAPVDGEAEVRSLWEGLADLADPGTLALCVLPGHRGLPDALARKLRERGCDVLAGPTSLKALSELACRFDVVHLIAHGAFSPGRDGGSGSGRLFLESPEGAADLVSDAELALRWGAASPQPRLVYLAACETAVRGDSEPAPFVGLGPRLVEAGVPAVVAMQARVPMELSTALTRRFFQGLLTHGIVDLALNEARRPLYEERTADWSIPVLFMRLDQGRLLAPDPLRDALAAIAGWSEDSLARTEPAMPIEAVRAPAPADAATLARLERAEEAGYEIDRAVREVLLVPRGDSGQRTESAPFAVLLGGEGSGKSVYLRKLVGDLARESLAGPGEDRLVPLLLNLADDWSGNAGRGTGRAGPLEHELAVESRLFEWLARFWPGLSHRRFRQLWGEPGGPTFLVLVDNTTAVSESERWVLCRGLARLAREGRRHRFLTVCDPGSLHQGPAAELPATDYLVVKRLAFHRVETYLSGLPDDRSAQDLGTALRDGRLFDLAGLPWLLAHMLRRARSGEMPRSRTAVLAGFVASALASLSGTESIRGRARESLRALALALQTERVRSLSLERTLEILDQVRGRREYRLHDMIDALIGSRLLVRVGQDRIQLAYPALQDYVCADAIRASPDAHARIDDITATLGRLSRLRWWANTLVLYAGLADDPSTPIALVLHGAGTGQEERVFLAARCIEEALATGRPVSGRSAPPGRAPDAAREPASGAGPRATRDDPLDPALRGQLAVALLQLADPSYESRVSTRIRAIDALQRLQETSAIPHLVRVAFEPARTNWLGKRVVEYSGVRLAAILALRALGQPALDAVQALHPELAELLVLWTRGEVPTLAERLLGGSREVQAIAAFLLGLLREGAAEDLLIAELRRPDRDRSVSWAIADALTLVDPARVTAEAILPFVDQGSGRAVALPGESPKAGRDRRRQVAYLIGKVKPAAPWARLYLEHSLCVATDVVLKSYAIWAFGDLLDNNRKGLLERIAIGDFQGIATPPRWRGEDRIWLRRAAVGALARIGDLETVRRLRGERREDAPWPAELELELFRTGEEIASRVWEADSVDGARWQA